MIRGEWGLRWAGFGRYRLTGYIDDACLSFRGERGTSPFRPDRHLTDGRHRGTMVTVSIHCGGLYQLTVFSSDIDPGLSSQVCGIRPCEELLCEAEHFLGTICSICHGKSANVATQVSVHTMVREYRRSASPTCLFVSQGSCDLSCECLVSAIAIPPHEYNHSSWRWPVSEASTPKRKWV